MPRKRKSFESVLATTSQKEVITEGHPLRKDIIEVTAGMLLTQLNYFVVVEPRICAMPSTQNKPAKHYRTVGQGECLRVPRFELARSVSVSGQYRPATKSERAYFDEKEKDQALVPRRPGEFLAVHDLFFHSHTLDWQASKTSLYLSEDGWQEPLTIIVAVEESYLDDIGNCRMILKPRRQYPVF